MTASTQLVASGAFVTLLPLGLAIGRVIGIQRARDWSALALPLAFGAMSVPLGVGALAGNFSPQWNGACGWLLAIGAAVFVLRANPNGRFALKSKPWSNGAIVITVLGFAMIIHALAVVESPIGSRDEGIYTMAAIGLERAGTAAIGGPSPLARASGLFEPFINNIPFYLPGIPVSDYLRPQFSPLFPAWIAQLHAVGGDALLYRFNLLAVLAYCAVVYALARRVVRRSFALLALLVLALNPASVWIARINLAEPLGALFALAGLSLVIASLHCNRRAIFVAAIALLALAALVRVDAFVLSPLLLGAAAVLASDDRRHEQARALLRCGMFAMIAQAAAIAILAVWSPPYVREQLRMLMLAPAASVLAIAVYAIVARHSRSPLFAQRRALAADVLCAVIAALFVYAAFVRPHIQPFALIPDRGSLLAGTRDFRENSLRDLAAYVGWPTIVLALVGVMLTIRRAARGRTSSAAIALSVIAVGTALVYLWAPGVSPDHPWAIRRMTTLVIPLTIVLAAQGLQSLVAATLHWRQRRFALLAGPVVVVSLFAMQWPTLTRSENAGLTAQIRALDVAIPPGPLVVRGNDGLATTLALGFGREVLPLRDEWVAVDAASRAFWVECGVRACTMLHQSYDGLNGLQIDPATPVQLSRDYLEPTFAPLASHRRHETLDILVSRIAGIATSPPPSNAGAARDWRLDDRGFYRDELGISGVARWTRGGATMTLAPSPADRIEIRVASAAPGPMPLRIDIDGVPHVDGTIAPGESLSRFRLDRWSAAPHRLTLQSGTFVPAGTSTLGDRRTLGVSVRSVRLLKGEPTVLDAQSPLTDFRSRVEVRPIVLGSNVPSALRVFRIDVDNRGAALWPAGADALRTFSPVALGYYWTRGGDSHRLMEQHIAMPDSLAPGERWSTQLTFDFDGLPLRGLPAGDYEVHLGMVLEGVAWFSDRGDQGITIPVTVGSR